MHKSAMSMSFAQARLLSAIERSGLTDAQMAALLSVNQSTVSRLKGGLIAKVAKYQKILDAHLDVTGDADHDEVRELVAMAEQSSELRDALIALARCLRKNA